MDQRIIVTPGDKLPGDVEAKEPYVVEINGVKVATTVGLLDTSGEKHVYIPLQSIYVPKKGDVVIGLVQSVGVVNWTLDINSPYNGVLPASDFLGRPYNPATDDLSQYLQVGDYVKVKIVAFDRTRNPLLTVQDKGLGKIVDGKILEVQPSKIPRIIGKKRSMLEMLKKETGCEIFVAVNGRIHVKCPDEDRETILILAIKMIERQAHTTGLTARVQEYIEELKKVKGVE